MLSGFNCVVVMDAYMDYRFGSSWHMVSSLRYPRIILVSIYTYVWQSIAVGTPLQHYGSRILDISSYVITGTIDINNKNISGLFIDCPLGPIVPAIKALAGWIQYKANL